MPLNACTNRQRSLRSGDFGIGRRRLGVPGKQNTEIHAVCVGYDLPKCFQVGEKKFTLITLTSPEKTAAENIGENRAAAGQVQLHTEYVFGIRARDRKLRNRMM